MTTIRGVDGFKALVGSELPPSDWFSVDQRLVDEFAKTTGDTQWIHVDPRRAAASALGTTVAHGFLTLSLLPRWWHATVQVEGFSSAVNYGLDRVRFAAPVLIPSRLRARFKITAVSDIPGGIRAKLHASVEREGEVKPACVAELLVLHYL